jgi:hypothetical protein
MLNISRVATINPPRLIFENVKVICCPFVARPGRAPIRRLLAQAISGDGFSDFAPKGQNGFVGCGNCFFAAPPRTDHSSDISTR